MKKIIFVLMLILLVPMFLFAQDEPWYKRMFNSEERDAAMDEAMRNVKIELTMEWLFDVNGKQTFGAIYDIDPFTGDKASQLIWPNRGNMLVIRSEVGILPFSIGGKYGSSFFKRTGSTDRDWLAGIGEIIFWESQARAKAKAELLDLNLYYRFFELNREGAEADMVSADEAETMNFLSVDKLALDAFVGYQYQKGRYSDTDGRDTIVGGAVENSVQDYDAEFEGLDSFFKVKYYGPRIGLRAHGSAGKVSSRVSLAYAWLTTRAYGWWNLRTYEFWFDGKRNRGSGLDGELEVDYNFTPNFSLGLGFDYYWRHQQKLHASGAFHNTVENDFLDENVIRDVDSYIYSPTVVARLIW